MTDLQVEDGEGKKSPESADCDRSTAAILSFFVPGLGQIYKGQTGRGIAWLLGGVFLATFSWLLLFIPSLVYSCCCAFNASRPVRAVRTP
jgi:TM2 domain-containing membrane protein YozV